MYLAIAYRRRCDKKRLTMSHNAFSHYCANLKTSTNLKFNFLSFDYVFNSNLIFHITRMDKCINSRNLFMTDNMPLLRTRYPQVGFCLSDRTFLAHLSRRLTK